MTSRELENLVKTNNLKREPASRREFEGLLQSGEARLKDAANEALADESRFDLAYNAAHALALAALRRLGYRSESRYLVFQTLPHTVGVAASVWRMLALCHERRNRAEYEGLLEVDDRLLADLIDAARVVLEAVRALPRWTPKLDAGLLVVFDFPHGVRISAWANAYGLRVRHMFA